MIVFELTMPHVASWNGKWTGSNRRYLRCYKECDVPKEVIGKDFGYQWNDGWGANVSVRKVAASVARKLEKQSAGFCGYDWMIRSIIRNGYITTGRDGQ